jgi:hypothetical protein
MTEYIDQENIPSPTELIDNSMQMSVEYTDGKPSAWKSLIDLIEANNAVDGNWTEQEHNSVKRFLKGFVIEIWSEKEILRHQVAQINWALDFEEEDIGELTDEELELVEKWSSRFEE